MIRWRCGKGESNMNLSVKIDDINEKEMEITLKGDTDLIFTLLELMKKQVDKMTELNNN